LESFISHRSIQLHKMSARSVTHISDEFNPNKCVGYGQIGTYVRVHVLFITNYVKYITYFKESVLPNGDYRYHELRPLISYFPCHWVVPVDFPNTCPMKDFLSNNCSIRTRYLL